MVAASDADRVRALLGRKPQGYYEIVVRDVNGDPVVLKNAPFLDDGTPMPTRYWLVSPDEIRRVGKLEAAGGVNAAEAAIEPNLIANAHARYAAERDADVPPEHVGPRPYGGVAGTRVGVKCLHAHWAWYLAGGDDPVGRWVEQQLAANLADTALPVDNQRVIAPDGVIIDLDDNSMLVALPDGASEEVPWGAVNLTSAWLADDDPPRPEALTNALGAIDDHLDDIERVHSTFRTFDRFTLRGLSIVALAQLEVGSAAPPAEVFLDRQSAEEVFRMIATEPSAQRVHNPGLPSDAVETIVATCVIVLALMRRLKLGSVMLDTASLDPKTAN